jgi:hypothetical protein
MLGSGFLAQSGCDFLLFSYKLVPFYSSFSNLGAISLVTCFFFLFEKGFTVGGNFPPKNWHFPPFGKKASCSWD